jgi:hypothetical protein
MFQSLKNALGLSKDQPDKPASELKASQLGHSKYSKVSEWASLQGFTSSERGDSKGFHIFGKVGDKPWRIEQGRPSRDFIKGLELRARGEMQVREDVSLMILTRSLKNDLEKCAFSLYTDSLQTIADPQLPEEMRWLSMYEEVGWESLGHAFLDQYAILADDKEHASAWLTPQLAQQLMAWPSAETGVPSQTDVPCVLMVLRGKIYLRMQISEGDLHTLEHATRVFTSACESAIASLTTDLSF